MPWTPRELIESLSKWDPDRPIDVGLTKNPHYEEPTPGDSRRLTEPSSEPKFSVILTQGSSLNMINLSDSGTSE